MKRIASLVLIILMALSSLPVVSADELGRGKFEASGTFASGKGTIYIKLDPPAESLVVSGTEMEVVLPKGFSFGGKSTQAISGWEITEGNVHTTDGRYAKKIAVYSTKKAVTTAKNSPVTLVNIPVTYATSLKPGNQVLDINVTDVAIDINVGDELQTVSGLQYFEHSGTGDNKKYEYSNGVKLEKSLSTATVTGIVDKTYTGKKIKQSPTVVVDGNTLVEDTDYYLDYDNETKCGIATVKIVGKNGYKGSITRTFLIIPAAIYEIACSNPTTSSVSLTWETSKDADGYYILRSTAKTDGYSVIKTVTGVATSTYTDNTVLSGTRYYYKVQAYKNIGGKKVAGRLTTATPSSQTSGYTVNQTTGLSVAGKTASTVSLKWKKTEIANNISNKIVSGYYIYRSTSAGGGFKLITTIKDGNTVTYKDTGLSQTTTYYYRVEPYRTYKGSICKGAFASVSAKTDISVSKPKSVKVSSNTTTSVKLSWKKVSKANGYYIYRSTKKTSGFKKIKTITKGSTVTFTNKKLSAGKTYYYRVIAYQNYNGKKCESSYSQITACTKPKVPKKVTLKKASKTSLKITASKVSGANGYQIYFSTKKKSGFKKAYSGSKLTYTKKSLKKGKTYFVKVRAYKSVGGKKYYGAYSSVKSIKL